MTESDPDKIEKIALEIRKKTITIIQKMPLRKKMKLINCIRTGKPSKDDEVNQAAKVIEEFSMHKVEGLSIEEQQAVVERMHQKNDEEKKQKGL